VRVEFVVAEVGDSLDSQTPTRDDCAPTTYAREAAGAVHHRPVFVNFARRRRRRFGEDHKVRSDMVDGPLPQLAIGDFLLAAVYPRVEIPGGYAESVHVDDPFKSISSGW